MFFSSFGFLKIQLSSIKKNRYFTNYEKKKVEQENFEVEREKASIKQKSNFNNITTIQKESSLIRY
ncbi:MAG: hypothetical protein DRJ05_13100 [Bacteroidetes bacterium]|nr:MAG: hypothetical protein DRJ05_13100 [Bacteroidota bacterium]